MDSMMEWRKSSYSGNGGADCVEMAALPGRVAVRDSKDPNGGRLSFTVSEMAALVRDVRAGKFDL